MRRCLTPGPCLYGPRPNSWLGVLPSPSESISVPAGTVTVNMPTSVDVVSSTDAGAAFLGSGGHTLSGAAIYFDEDQFLYTTINGVGATPDVSGTAHQIALTGTAPFSAEAWATAAEAVIAAAGYTVSRSTATLTVTVATEARASAAETAQDALTSFADRGDGYVAGALQRSAGGSTPGNSTGWIQVDPADVPSGAFRIIALGVRRGNDVSNGIRIGCALAPNGQNGDPEGAGATAADRHDRTMGDSGVNQWHYEYLSPAEVVYGSGGEAIYLSSHGDGAGSSIYGSGSINDGLYGNGNNNLWLTDGTTGSTTPVSFPVGAVTNGSGNNYGLAIRCVIQEAPYQADGGYRVVAGAVEGRHDQNLQPNQTPVDNIFVGWRIETPAIDDVQLVDTHVYLASHAAGDSNQVRLELWNPAGGAATMTGDTLIAEIGTTSDTQGTGWSSVQTTPVALTPETDYRFTMKGSPAPGEEEDTILGVWLGTAGADSRNLAGYPAYSATNDLPDTEREVQAVPDSGTPETALDFDPTVATASPNPANGTVISPNNLPMISLFLGKPAPTVTAG